MKKVYISGPMTGLPDHNKTEFARAERYWSDLGYQVVNPLQNDYIYDKEGYIAVLAQDIKDMLACDIVAVLPDWQNSKGAVQEVAVAIANGLEIYDAFSMRKLYCSVKFQFNIAHTLKSAKKFNSN